METTPPPEHLSPRERAAVARYAQLAFLFDQAFRIPGTKFRFGLDSLIGLVPGLGDVAGSVMGLYGIAIARSLGAPASVQGRMLMNIALDAIVGAVPLLGDLFDFAFKAHVRNRRLLEQWLAAPRATRRSSRFTFSMMVIALFAIAGGALWLAVVTLGALFRWLGSLGASPVG